MQIPLRSVASFCLMLGFGSTLLMCGSTAGSFCDAKCDCRGCSDRDYDDCLFDYDDDELRADRRGCLDFYYDYTDCVAADGCRGTDYDHYCETEKDRWRNCID